MPKITGSLTDPNLRAVFDKLGRVTGVVSSANGKSSNLNTVYSSLSDFTAAGGPAYYGAGVLWIGGVQNYCDGTNLTPLSSKAVNSNVIAILGDSGASRNSDITATYLQYNLSGPIAWMSCYMGWTWTWEPSDNYGVSGYNTSQVISNELPLLLAAHATRNYQRAFISVGTEDTFAGVPIATVKSNLLIIFNTLRSVGIIPVHMGIKPRGSDVSMQNYKLANAAINQWLYGLSLTGLIEYYDNGELYADNSTAYGNALALYMPDYLTQNNLGAQLEGQALANMYIAKGFQPGIIFATEQSDAFDPTYNRNGVLTSPANPLLLGATMPPTGFTLGGGGVWSKVSRTLPNGQIRNDSTIAAVSSSAQQQLRANRTGTGGWGANDPQPGETIECRSKINIVGAANVSSFKLFITENNGASSFSSSSMDATALSPNVSLLPGNHTLYIKTPRLKIRAYGGSGNATIDTNQLIGTSASATGSFTVQAFECRVVT